MSVLLNIEARYRPAQHFAGQASSWIRKEPATGAPPFYIGDEGIFLAFFYSYLSLEALIAQFLTDETRANNDYLLASSVSILQRWRDGSQRLTSGSPESNEAVKQIKELCDNKGKYGLLVRARNKLVHPKAYTEVMYDRGHIIQDGTVDQLIADIRSSAIGIPDLQPAFPNMLTCLPASKWAIQTLKEMTELLHTVVSKRLDEQWTRVFSGI